MVIFQQNTCKTGFFELSDFIYYLKEIRKKCTTGYNNVFIYPQSTYIYIYLQFQYTPLLQYCDTCNEEKDQK